FAGVRALIEILQTLILRGMLFRYFFPRFGEPLMIGAWAVAVLALTAVGAFLMILTPAALPINPSNLEIELARDPALAWRHWWLGNACAYLTLAGPVAALTVLRQRLKRLLFTPGSERRKFIGLALSLLV